MGWVNLPESTPTLNWPTPMKAYINSATDNAIVYEGINSNPNYGKIFVTDECVIDTVYTNHIHLKRKAPRRTLVKKQNYLDQLDYSHRRTVTFAAA